MADPRTIGQHGSRIIAALEHAWAAIQEQHPDVPDVVIVTGAGSNQKGSLEGYQLRGHHWPERWVISGQDQPRAPELFVAGELLAAGGRAVVEVMLHEAAHALAARRGIKDTSAAGNGYHNKRFVALAAELGLRGPDVPDKITGWSHCTLQGQAAYDAWAEVTARIDAARLPFLVDLASPARPGGEGGGDQGDDGPGKPAKRGGRRTPVECACLPEPRRIQLTPKQIEDATLASRKAKQHGRSDRSGMPPASAGEELDAWEKRTTEREVAALSAVHAAVRAFAAPEGLERPGVLSAQQRGSVIRRAVDAAQRSAAAFTRAALLWEVHRAMPAMAAGVDQAALAEELAAEAVSSGAVLALGPAPDVVDVSALGLRASDGRSVYTPPGGERYTTPAHLDLEEYLVREAAREVPQLVTPAQAALALALSDLDPAQAEVAAGLLAARTAVSVLVAPAGSGKTHTMAAVARAWTQWTGGRAVGVTLSTNAARVMATEGMTQAVNVARFLGRLEDGGSRGAMRLTSRDVVVVDEASQVCTEDLAAIVAVVRAAGARAILTGDTAQLGTVDAGGMMRLIAADLGHWELAEVRRFDEEWEARASLQLREGQRAALHAYDARGRVRGNHRQAAVRDEVALYLVDLLMGRDVMLLAGTNEEAAELAAMVRAELVRLGRDSRAACPAAPARSSARSGGGAATSGASNSWRTRP